MSHIRYLAIISDAPTELAEFYQSQIGLKEFARSNHNDVSLTDGFYNIAILNRRAELNEPRMEIGQHHIGLNVDSIEETLVRYRRFYPNGLITPEPDDRHHGQIRIFDPEANPITLSEDGFGLGKGEKQTPRLVHVAFNALVPETLMRFYNDVFGINEVGTSFTFRQNGRPNRFLGDGVTNLAIHPFYTDSVGHEGRMGVNHVGFLVDDMRGKLKRLENQIPVAERPSIRPFAEYRLRDPQGNAFDFSQMKGWEVRLNKWDKVM